MSTLQLDNGWVHGVSFSPSGEKLVMVTHGSMVSVGAGGETPLVQLRTEHLPYNSVQWITKELNVRVHVVKRKTGLNWQDAHQKVLKENSVTEMIFGTYMNSVHVRLD